MNPLLRFFLLLTLFFSSAFANSTDEQISLQLKWFSSFQFAGYYMALEKGYYRDAGLNVTIRERNPKRNNIEQVLQGESQYGVADSSLLLYRAEGKPIKVMASIFQHSPLIFIAHKESGIVSPYEMKGKRVSYQQGVDEAPLIAMLHEAQIKPSDYTYVPLDFSSKAFIERKVDVISAYLSDQPFIMKQLNIPITIINPLNYGIDFYGDNLFSTEKELVNNPERAKRFLAASLKGWRYALEHQEECIQLLHTKYHAQRTIDHLRSEAKIIEGMMLPQMVDIGYTSSDRFYRIGEVYKTLNKANKNDIDNALNGLIWNPNEKRQIDVKYFYFLIILLLSIIALTILFITISQKLKKMVIKRTRALSDEQAMTDKYVIISSTNLAGVITYVSEAFCDISGYSKNELIGKKHTILRHPAYDKLFFKELWNRLHKNKRWSGEIKNLDRNGKTYWVLTNIEPIFDEKGVKIGYRGIQQNITDKKYTEQLSITDQLTQLYNRNYLDTILHKELTRFVRYRTLMCLIMIDIDYFKEVNDHYGHVCGDRVLIEIANLLKSNIRATDTLGRWGGEEFMIICSHNTLHEAQLLANKLRLAIELHTFDTVGKKTASFGVTEIREDDNDLSLVQRVDAALYKAKELGRNQVAKI